MSTDRKIQNIFLGIGALFILGLFVWTFYQRVLYPFDLEWMEGGMLIHGLRVMNGEGLYVEPSSDFIPFIYPPLYSWILGLGGWLWGLDYSMGRSISAVATLFAAAALFRVMRIEGAGWGLSAFAAGVFISLYDETGSFYDLVRADGCLIALLAWSMVNVRQNRPVWAGMLLFVAFLAKHNAAIFGLPSLWWIWKYYGKTSAIRYSVSSILPALFAVGVLQWQTDGYFLTYLLAVPANHPFVTQRFMWLSFHELIGGVWMIALIGVLSCLWWSVQQKSSYGRWLQSGTGFLVVVGAYLFLAKMRPMPVIGDWPKDVTVCLVAGLMWIGVFLLMQPLWRVERQSSHRLWLWAGGLSLLFSAIMRGHHGGYMNVLIPGAWFLALWVGLLGQYWFKKLGSKGRWLMVVVFLIQIWDGRWDLKRYVPTETDIKAGKTLIERLEAIEGPIFAPHFPWYPVIAGHPPTTHLISLWDIDHEGGVLFDSVESIRQDIRNRRFDAVLAPNSRYDYGVLKMYPERESLMLSGRGLMPKTGWRVRPTLLMLPPKNLEKDPID